MKRRIVLLGPPASGKGTQAEMITARYEIPSASPGSMLREERAAGSALGAEADGFTSQGRLVPDSIANQLVAGWLEKHDSQFIFDGYPRSLGQANALEQMLAARSAPVEVALSFEADLTTLQGRVMSRCVCSECARNFSSGIHDVAVDAPCPSCGAPLLRRSDDTLETLAVRMDEYRAKSVPLIGFYRERGLLRTIDATQSPEKVFGSVVRILEEP